MKKIILLLALAAVITPPTMARMLFAANPFPWAVTAPPRALGDIPQLPASSIRSLDASPGIYPVSTVSKAKKLGFWNRLALRMAPKKYRAQLYLAMQDTAEADKKAKNSLIIGSIALACAIVPWYTLFAAIPLGIAAIVIGSKARRMGSTKMTGTGFGIAALVLVGLWLIIGVLLVASGTWALFTI